MTMAAPGLAAIITVTTAGDGPVGVSPGECSLRAAIASANDDTAHDGCQSGSSGPDEIRFEAGLAGSTITLTEGQFDISDDLTVTGPDPGNPAGLGIDADGASRIISMIGDETDPFHVGLSSLTLTGGNTTGTGAAGGGIEAEDADLTLNHVIVTENSTADSGQNAHGGGIGMRDGTLSVHDSEISNNSIANTGGGGVAVTLGELIIERSRITGNSIADGEFDLGGGVSVFRSNATITDSLISGNSIAGDSAEGAGVAFRLGDFQLTIRGSTISGNSIDGNDAVGAGIFVERARMTALNSTISGNAITGTGGNGGGVWLGGDDDEPGHASLVHVTVLGNTADGTDGIHFDPDHTQTITLDNSLVIQTSAGETACTQTVDGANSLATDTSCTGSATDLSNLGPGPLQNNGGPTPTHSLGRDSGAINAAGDCVDEHGIDTDQRGLPRPGTENPACDSGAWEFQDQVFRDRFEAE